MAGPYDARIALLRTQWLAVVTNAGGTVVIMWSAPFTSATEAMNEAERMASCYNNGVHTEAPA